MFKGIEYQDEICRKIKGFFQYKLFGLKKYNLDVESNNNILIEFYRILDIIEKMLLNILNLQEVKFL